MNTVVVCEENIVIRQDLVEIVEGYDPTLRVMPFVDLSSAEGAIAEAPDLVAVIASGTVGAEDTRRILDIIRTRGGRIIWVGDQRSAVSPACDWIVIEAPFTTDSVEKALALAAAPLQARPA